jgi:transcription-repair coupling factor (superfamily II helicase)
MSPEDIEDRIHDFKSQKYDILITTTIVENGVNFLTANTILILDPQDYGLAQLHQLRGRVGRRDIQGYCYLMYRKPELSPDEKERLVTLVNHSHLGAGFEIAMRDMEMRGAGDILGIRQAGKVKEVGVSLYFKMLEEKVEQIRTGKVYENNKTHIQLAISYAIDDIYFDSDIDKISFFRNVESLDTVQDIDTAEQSFLSLHTTLSTEAKNFFMVMRASIYLGAYRVTKVSEVGTSYIYEFAVGTTVDTLRAFLGRYDTRKNYVIVSGTRIRVDTRLYSGVEDFLYSIVG